MKLEKAKDLWKLTDVELDKELKATQEAVYKLRFQKIVGELTDVNLIKKNRRKIARINTLLRLRQEQKGKIKEETK